MWGNAPTAYQPDMNISVHMKLLDGWQREKTHQC